MPTPTGVRLNPGQLCVELIDVSTTGITSPTPNTISQGTVVQAYSNQMSYSINQDIVFNNQKSVFFNQDDVTYAIINQNNVFFQVSPPL